MKRGTGITICLLLIVLLSLSFVSAGWFSDLFKVKPTGKVITGDAISVDLNTKEIYDASGIPPAPESEIICPANKPIVCGAQNLYSGDPPCCGDRLDMLWCCAAPTGLNVDLSTKRAVNANEAGGATAAGDAICNSNEVVCGAINAPDSITHLDQVYCCQANVDVSSAADLSAPGMELVDSAQPGEDLVCPDGKVVCGMRNRVDDPNIRGEENMLDNIWCCDADIDNSNTLACAVRYPRYGTYLVKGLTDEVNLSFTYDGPGVNYFARIATDTTGDYSLDSVLCENYVADGLDRSGDEEVYQCSWSAATAGDDYRIDVVVGDDRYFWDANWQPGDPVPPADSWTMCPPNGYNGNVRTDASQYVKVIDDTVRICKDSDQGFDPYVFGTAQGQLGAWDGTSCGYPTTVCDAHTNVREDTCIDANGNPAISGPKVKENYCKEDGVWGAVVDCPIGCYDGKCVGTNQCVDEDNGEDLSTHAFIYGYAEWDDTHWGVWNDWCSGRVGIKDPPVPGEITEYSCVNGKVHAEVKTCPTGSVCSDGKCTSDISCELIMPSGPVTKVGSDLQEFEFTFTGNVDRYTLAVGASDPAGWYHDFELCRAYFQDLTPAEIAAGKASYTCDWLDKDAPTRDFYPLLFVMDDTVDETDPSSVRIGDNVAVCQGMDPIKILGSYKQIRLYNGTIGDFGDGGQTIIVAEDIVPSILPQGSLTNYKLLFTNLDKSDAPADGEMFSITSASDSSELQLSGRPSVEPRNGDPFDIIVVLEGARAGDAAGICSNAAISAQPLPAGTRVNDPARDGGLLYCDPFTSNFLPVKAIGEPCLMDYQCITNVCLDNECTSVREELAEQTALIWRIWCAITNPIDFSNRDDDGEDRTNNDYHACVYRGTDEGRCNDQDADAPEDGIYTRTHITIDALTDDPAAAAYDTCVECATTNSVPPHTRCAKVREMKCENGESTFEDITCPGAEGCVGGRCACYDDDADESNPYLVKGHTNGPHFEAVDDLTRAYYGTDYCIDGETLREYSCDANGIVAGTPIVCSEELGQEYSCDATAGACVASA